MVDMLEQASNHCGRESIVDITTIVKFEL
jgi:hypothetical protein